MPPASPDQPSRADLATSVAAFALVTVAAAWGLNLVQQTWAEPLTAAGIRLSWLAPTLGAVAALPLRGTRLRIGRRFSWVVVGRALVAIGSIALCWMVLVQLYRADARPMPVVNFGQLPWPLTILGVAFGTLFTELGLRSVLHPTLRTRLPLLAAAGITGLVTAAADPRIWTFAPVVLTLAIVHHLAYAALAAVWIDRLKGGQLVVATSAGFVMNLQLVLILNEEAGVLYAWACLAAVWLLSAAGAWWLNRSHLWSRQQAGTDRVASDVR